MTHGPSNNSPALGNDGGYPTRIGRRRPPTFPSSFDSGMSIVQGRVKEFSMRERQGWGRAVVVVAVLLGGAIDAQAQSAGSSVQRVPLRTGLTIVTALNEPDKGDYESIKQIIDVNKKSVRLRYSAEVPAAASDDNPIAALFGGKPTEKKADGSEVRRVVTTRTVAREDLENAGDYRWLYNDNAPESYPGSTAVGVSRKVVN